MKAAISAAGSDLNAVIPAQFETSQCILIVETNTMEIIDRITDDIANAILLHDCEMLLCGEIYDPVFFDNLAENGVSRYNASGLIVQEAIQRGLCNALPLLRDYVGGTGCHSHDRGGCSCPSHSNNDE